MRTRIYQLLCVLVILLSFACKKNTEEEKVEPSTCLRTFEIENIKTLLRSIFYEGNFPGEPEPVRVSINISFDLNQIGGSDCTEPYKDSILGRLDTLIVIGLYDYNSNFHAGDCFNSLFKIGEVVDNLHFPIMQPFNEYIAKKPVCYRLYLETWTPPDTNITEQFVITYKLTDGQTFVDTTNELLIKAPNN